MTHTESTSSFLSDSLFDDTGEFLSFLLFFLQRFQSEKPDFANSRPRCCELCSCEASALAANQQSRSDAMLSSGVGGGQKHGVVNCHKVVLEVAIPEDREQRQNNSQKSQ